MTCQQAQSLITEYVQEQLDTKTLECFLEHVKNCPDCLEELEVYYIVFTGFKRLDEDDNIAINYHEQFKESMRVSGCQVRKSHRLYIMRRVMFAVIMCSIMFISNYSFSTHELEEALIYRVDGESVFELPYYFYKEGPTDLDLEIIKYTRIEIIKPPNNTNISVFSSLIDGAKAQLRLQLNETLEK